MITGVILTHNEQTNIVECIKCLRPHVSEVILVDTESADQTVSLAMPLVDRVLFHPHVPNFDSARNIAIPEAKNDWLWFVDADEFISLSTGELVNSWIREQGHAFEAINIPFKSYFCGRWMQHCGWWPGYTCPRVLKRGFFQFSETLHGGVELDGREVRAPATEGIGIEHRSFRDLNHWIEKFNRYTATEALQLANRGVVYDWRGAIRFMVHDLWEHYEKFDARLDGERGWILTWCAALYRWMSVTKLIDHGRSPEQMVGIASVPANLDEVFQAFGEELAFFRKNEPTLPLGVVIRSARRAGTVDLKEVRSWVRELAHQRRSVKIETSGSEDWRLDDEDALVWAFSQCKRSSSVITITLASDEIIPIDEFAAVNVLRLHEGAEVTPSHTHWLCEYDQVWVTDNIACERLRSLGAAPEIIRIASRDASGSVRRDFLGAAIAEIENDYARCVLDPPPIEQVHVALEGEFFAGHSFANINEHLAVRFANDGRIGLAANATNQKQICSLKRPKIKRIQPLLGRELKRSPDVTIRHAFPPNWAKPQGGKWVHIQPWEFGYLPNDWLVPMRDHVDELWVMSRYVERVYLRSGIPAGKIHYIPWGIDQDVFKPDVTKRKLATRKQFRFLYVGGTVLRKGFDRLLRAYLEEFSPDDDVCLVVKDVGADSFYEPHSMRGEVERAMAAPGAAEILYFSDEFTHGQLASLYASCHCFVAPYRGEGFGLPILEAMACGLAPIVPRGGPTDDFVTEETGYFLPTQIVDAEGVINLCGPATELFVSPQDLRKVMRQAYCEAPVTRQRGMRASQYVRSSFTWDRTVEMMIDRLCEIKSEKGAFQESIIEGKSVFAVVVRSNGDRWALVETLSRMCINCVSIYVEICDGDSQSDRIAEEYGAIPFRSPNSPRIQAKWAVVIHAGEYIREEDQSRLHILLEKFPDSVLRVQFDETNIVMHGESTGDQSFIARLGESCEIGNLYLGSIHKVEECRSGFGVESCDIVLGKVANAASTKKQAKHGSTTFSTIQNEAINGALCYGKLKKSVLIQMASGSHCQLMDLTRNHHRRYANRHGLDYWDVDGNPSGDGKRAGWGKIPLILAAICMGYTQAIWLDADAVIVDVEVNLADQIRQGIGMVRHASPEHWNTGLMIVCASEQVDRFWRTIAECPENESPWMEQVAVNNLLAFPEFSSLACEIDLRFNSVPNVFTSLNPVVVAGHGLPYSQREAIITDVLRPRSRLRSPLGFKRLVSREEFPIELNRRGLIGEAVEVGACRGEFSESLLRNWKGRLLHLVDPWRHLNGYGDIANVSDIEHANNLEIVKKRLLPFANRVRIHRALSMQAVEHFRDGTLDFVYLDANHSFEAVSRDLESWFPKVKRGGIIAGHDYLDGVLAEGVFGVESAVNAFVTKHRIDLHLTEDPPWRSWYVVRS